MFWVLNTEESCHRTITRFKSDCWVVLLRTGEARRGEAACFKKRTPFPVQRQTGDLVRSGFGKGERCSRVSVPQCLRPRESSPFWPQRTAQCQGSVHSSLQSNDLESSSCFCSSEDPSSEVWISETTAWVWRLSLQQSAFPGCSLGQVSFSARRRLQGFL